jgi:hypothetical protein
MDTERIRPFHGERVSDHSVRTGAAHVMTVFICCCWSVSVNKTLFKHFSVDTNWRSEPTESQFLH